MLEEHWISSLPEVGSTPAFDALAHVHPPLDRRSPRPPGKSRGAHFLMLQEANMEDVEAKFPATGRHDPQLQHRPARSDSALTSALARKTGELDPALDPELEALGDSQHLARDHPSLAG